MCTYIMSSNNQTNNCFVLLRNNYRQFFNYEHFYIQGLVYNSRALQLIGQGLQEQKNRGKGINVARSFLQGSAFFLLELWIAFLYSEAAVLLHWLFSWISSLRDKFLFIFSMLIGKIILISILARIIIIMFLS